MIWSIFCKKSISSLEISGELQVYFAHKQNTSKSDILIKSLETWISVQNEGQFQDLLILPKTMACFLFEIAPEEKLKDFLMDQSKTFIDITKIKLNENAKEFSVKNFLEILKDDFSRDIFAWFDKFTYQISDDKTITVIGLHSMNRGFSIFFRYVLENMLKFSFNYTIIEESISITENSVSMKFFPNLQK